MPGPASRVVVLADQWSELSETFIASEVHALRELGADVRVEAARPADRPVASAMEGVPSAFAADDAVVARIAALAWLVARHPRACVRDVRARTRWARDEWVPRLWRIAPVARRVARFEADHLHAHFAMGAALTALRLGQLLGLPYSVTAHAYDIYVTPTNLPEKLARAAFATSGCEYTVRDLRAIAPTADVHEIVMGVDLERFTRTRPYPGGRSLLAVGRLVEKKGFGVLIDAVARLDDVTLTIVGDGPLADTLRAQVSSLGVDDRVELAGALEPEVIRTRLEAADLVVVPSVVAGDGDRDSMPVVAKEALAMEVPVVASDEVGLPELIRDGWGRLVAPGDAASLAGAIDELLSLPATERAAMGRAGRAFVAERCDVRAETRKLLGLMRQRGPGA